MTVTCNMDPGVGSREKRKIGKQWVRPGDSGFAFKVACLG